MCSSKINELTNRKELKVMDKKIMFLDFDDTITDSLSECVRILNKANKLNISPKDVFRWDMTDVFTNINEVILEECCFCSDEFWNNLKYKEFCVPALIELGERYDFVIISKGSAVNIQKKTKFVEKLKEYLKCTADINLDFIALGLNQSKADVPMPKGSIMIDDNLKYLNETNADFKILFTDSNVGVYHEWNQGDRSEIYAVADGWKDVLNIVKRIEVENYGK